jgi:molybdenum cofactor cytidylyltransferase
MNLADALQVKPHDVVVFVGAGGKTSAMFRLANELAEQGWRVITTTTTRIGQDELRFAPQHVGFGHGMRLPDTLPDQVQHHHHVFVFTKLENDGKVKGVRASWLDENLSKAPYLDVLIVEADGSRRLPMKAPLPNEPVVPESATIVVPVIGIDALGQPLDEQHVYGAESIHRIMGHSLQEPVTSELIAAVLMHPQLGLKSIPRGARIVPLINKVSEGTIADARKVARYVLTDLNIERVILASLRDSDPVLEVRQRIGAIVLAAGESRRMGEPKLLLPWKDKTIIYQVCQQIVASGVYETVVVAGRWEQEIRLQLADLSVRITSNPSFATTEMLASLKVGLEAVWHTSDAALIVLGDQPAIQQSTIQDVINAYAQGKGRIVAPSYNNQRGHPILIDRALWDSLIDLPADGAPRDVIRANEKEVYHLVVDTNTVLRDIDTPEDYRGALNGDGLMEE